MKVRLDAGDVDFLHKKAEQPNIDLTHSSRLFPQKARRSFGFQLLAWITYRRPQLEYKPSLRSCNDVKTLPYIPRKTFLIERIVGEQAAIVYNCRRGPTCW